MVGFVPLLPGCAAARHEVRTPVPIIPGQPVVFSVDGAGKYNGTTSALEFAPCSDVAVNPPGTFPDEFQFDGVFDGTVAGEPAHANMLYAGRVQVGGAIAGRFVFSKGVEGRLDVDSRVAVGGDYRGMVVIQTP